MKKRVNEWIKYSKLDLDSALKLLENPELTQSAAFHCQQSIEKSLKAIIEEKIRKVPRTHDLIKLNGLIEECGIKLSINEDVLDQVNDVYIETRYPSDLGLIPEGIPKVETIKYFYDLSESIHKQVIEVFNIREKNS